MSQDRPRFRHPSPNSWFRSSLNVSGSFADNLGEPSASSSRDSYGYSDVDLRELKELLDNVTKQYNAPSMNTSDTNRDMHELASQLKRMNDARLSAERDTAKAKEELKYIVGAFLEKLQAITYLRFLDYTNFN